MRVLTIVKRLLFTWKHEKHDNTHRKCKLPWLINVPVHHLVRRNKSSALTERISKASMSKRDVSHIRKEKSHDFTMKSRKTCSFLELEILIPKLVQKKRRLHNSIIFNKYTPSWWCILGEKQYPNLAEVNQYSWVKSYSSVYYSISSEFMKRQDVVNKHCHMNQNETNRLSLSWKYDGFSNVIFIKLPS